MPPAAPGARHASARASSPALALTVVVRTSIGTVLGFSSLLLADSPGLQLLGGIVAFGSVACMLSCLFVLAPLLAHAAPDPSNPS